LRPPSTLPQLGLAALASAAARASGRPLGVVLLYHRVAAAPPPDPLVPAVAARDFERQLGLLARVYDVVPLGELREAIARRRRGGRIPAAITFDDDLPEHATVAAPRLRARGLPATFFLCGASLERPHVFWWELLELARARGLDPAALLPAELGVAAGAPLPEVADRLKWAAPGERARAEEALAAALAPVEVPVLGPGGSRELAGAFDIGFHTLRHPFLPRLDDEGLERALRDGRDALAALAGRPLTAIAYPHGGVDERVGPAARRAGYAIGVTTDATAVGDDPLMTGRVEPGPVPLGRFWLRIERALRRR
jgi:peptidoglycan/xylan/chitin deacetylase (PgdA/CDA1 family)